MLRLTDPRVLAGGLVVALAGGFGAGWAVNGWRLDAALQRCEAASARQDAAAAQDALDRMQTAAAAVAEAASSVTAAGQRAAQANDAARRQWQAAVARTPLPADCRRDAARAQALDAAVKRAQETMP